MTCWIPPKDDKSHTNISKEVPNESIQDISTKELPKTMSRDPIRPNRPVSDNKNCSPHDIFKRHMSEMLGVISDTERLANDQHTH